MSDRPLFLLEGEAEIQIVNSLLAEMQHRLTRNMLSGVVRPEFWRLHMRLWSFVKEMDRPSGTQE